MDTPIDLHVRTESGDHPDLAGGLNPADNVPVHDLGGGRLPHAAGNRDDPDSPFEFYEGATRSIAIVLPGLLRYDGQHKQHDEER